MRRYRIGILAVHSAIDYPHALRMGVRNALEEAGHTLVTIADAIPYHTLINAESYLRVSCEIAARLDLDVIIFPAGCVTTYLKGDSAKALEFLQAFDPAKTLVLEREVPGFRCITKDNAPGMHACMRHLIEDCGFTQIGFVSGPAKSKGAHERESIYFEEMRAHGLEPSPSLFARGNFAGDCADVIEKLIDDNPGMEAIACACDLIAYTTYDVLRNRGLMVGEDMAVTGFDDNPRSALFDPPLSTVHMTSYDLGYMAATEALRMCEGLPQQRTSITSTFIARSSCGEGQRHGVEYFRTLLRQKPFPMEAFISVLMESTISMAGPRVWNAFHEQMSNFFLKIAASYRKHTSDPQPDDLLFSSQDLATLFKQDYHSYLSLEGFHNVAITLLEALLEESSSDDVNWVVEQISHLHLRIARLLNSTEKSEILKSNKREWITSHIVDDALREDGDPVEAYRLIIEDLARLGMDEADLFLLPESVEFVEARLFAMSDTIVPLGSLSRGETTLAEDAEPIVLQRLLACVLPRYEHRTECVVGGLLAGNEMMGIIATSNHRLSDHDELMALINMGHAFKHLQMIATERELNDLLNRNNLLLRQESQHDVMTGLLNRRGFLNMTLRLVGENVGREAAVLYLDLDGLKRINDTFGHDMGDVAIRATAKILNEQMHEDDVLSRLGGDEFVACVLLDDSAQLDELLNSIQAAMHAYNEAHDHPFGLSISSGAALFTIGEKMAAQIPNLMAKADERLYEMKRQRKAQA